MCGAIRLPRRRHTSNTAESFNALPKRTWNGVWHWFPISHLHRYLNQIVFHWNHRGADVLTRLGSLFTARSRRIRFRRVVA